jgi:hypothetical protein
MNQKTELKNLEEAITDKVIKKFDPACVKTRSNLGKNSKHYNFDNLAFSPEVLLKDMALRSPKLQALVKKIAALDNADLKKHGKLFKHFIFSDLKSNSSGAKLVASAMISTGYHLGYSAKLKKGVTLETHGSHDEDDEDENNSDSDEEEDEYDDDERTPLSLVSLRNLKRGGAKQPKKIYEKTTFKTNDQLAETKNKNFYLLCSSGVFDQPVSVGMKKEIIQRFNERPDNIYGENVRFIIMDSGYKEGIDLFDIKYLHIFEPAPIMADQKQIIGRGTRTCGQKGLEFHPTRGWPLRVFIYDLEIPNKLKYGLDNSITGLELYLKAMNLDVRLLKFTHELEKTCVFGAVDYELNKNVHLFSIPSEDAEEELPEGAEFVYGGAITKRRTLRVRHDLPPIIVNTTKLSDEIEFREPIKPMNFEETREYIRRNFSQYEWDHVKMENLCAEQKGGGGQLIKFTPTQDFIRHYFTPANPLKGMLLYQSVGTGKCHAKDTPILMYDGSIKMVQDIMEGDELMGDDSTPRKVLSLARGQDEMYDIIPTKGEKYTVNSEHILCLKPSRLSVTTTKIRSIHQESRENITGFHQEILLQKKVRNWNTPKGREGVRGNRGFPLTKMASSVKYTARYINNKTGKINSKIFGTKEEAEQYLDTMQNDKNYILEIPLNEYLKLPKCSRRNLKGYRTGVSFTKQDIDFDPYIIGYWLGDGSKRDSVISTQDAQVIKHLYGELPKHIPNEYKINNRQNQLSLLAGLIDAHGCKNKKGYDIVQKNLTIAEDIAFVCRSLGFSAYIHLCTFKTPTSWAVMSERGDTDCAFKMRNGVKCFNKSEKKYRISINGNELHEIPVKIAKKKFEPKTQIKDVSLTAIEAKHVGRGDYYGFTLDGNNRYLLGDFTVTHNTCTAIAAATTTFEKQGYTILWVTRTTLKTDIWKNMFDQVCNESIREQITDAAYKIPADMKSRMKLVSKAWRIRPMSYKQFSNLVSKQNTFYNTLVKINGQEDPLRKTLLIIDEAHKLYSGDLSTIEQPDMEKFHTAVMNSYLTSGSQSVKLLLMTATPITKDPMELIKLLNLCKSPDRQFPSSFDTFGEKYLDTEGAFSKTGEKRFLDDIAGHISYLNREKDARQFAQPQIERISVPIISDIKMAEMFDKKAVRMYMESDLNELQNELKENADKIADEINVTAGDFAFLKDRCAEIDDPQLKRECKKIVAANIKDLVSEAKEEMERMKSTVKEIRATIKERNELRKSLSKDITANQTQFAEQYAEYKNSLYYQLKSKCAKPVKITNKFREDVFENHPDFIDFNRELDAYNERIDELQTALKLDTEGYKNRISRIKKLLKTDLNQLERSVVKMVLRDERKTMRVLTREKTKSTNDMVNKIQKAAKITQKARDKKYAKLRKTLKTELMKDKRDMKKVKTEEKKLQKALLKQEGNLDGVSERIQYLVDTYSKNIEAEIDNAREALHQERADRATRKAQAKTQRKTKKSM